MNLPDWKALFRKWDNEMTIPIKPKRGRKRSIYKNQVWNAFRPGEDPVFNDDWTMRNSGGNLMCCVRSLEALERCAKQCKVTLQWRMSGD